MNAIVVQYMNKKRENQDHFDVMREIQKQPQTSQRDLADTFGDPIFQTDANNNPVNGREKGFFYNYYVFII